MPCVTSALLSHLSQAVLVANQLCDNIRVHISPKGVPQLLEYSSEKARKVTAGAFTTALEVVLPTYMTEHV